MSAVKGLARSQLESGNRRLIKTVGLISFVLIASGLSMSLFSGKSINLGLASIFLILLGFGLLTPVMTLLLMKLISVFSGVF